MLRSPKVLLAVRMLISRLICHGGGRDVRWACFLRSLQITFCDGSSFFGFFDVGNLCRATREEDLWRRRVLYMFITFHGAIFFSLCVSKPSKSNKIFPNWPQSLCERKSKEIILVAECNLNRFLVSLYKRILPGTGLGWKEPLVLNRHIIDKQTYETF